MISLGSTSVLWVFIGFSLAFGESAGGIIGSPASFPLFLNIDICTRVGYPMQPAPSSIPALLFAGYHMMFAVIAPALITGAFAERLLFTPYLIFIVCAPAAATRSRRAPRLRGLPNPSEQPPACARAALAPTTPQGETRPWRGQAVGPPGLLPLRPLDLEPPGLPRRLGGPPHTLPPLPTHASSRCPASEGRRGRGVLRPDGPLLAPAPPSCAGGVAAARPLSRLSLTAS